MKRKTVHFVGSAFYFPANSRCRSTRRGCLGQSHDEGFHRADCGEHPEGGCSLHSQFRHWCGWLFALSLLTPQTVAAQAVYCGAVLTQSVTLTADLDCRATFGNGLTIISSSDISLNCDGHRITGGNAPGSAGVELSDVSRVTVMNCAITGFSEGISVDFGANNAIRRNTADNNSDNGFRVFLSSNNELERNSASSNRDGFGILGSTNNQIRENTVSDNQRAGFSMQGSSGNTVEHNTANNALLGFLSEFGTNNRFAHNTANENNFGFLFNREEQDETILHNTANDNVIGLSTRTSNSVFEHNELRGSVNFGFILSDARIQDGSGTNNLIRGNIVSGSGFNGVLITSSRGNLSMNNIFRDNVAENNGRIARASGFAFTSGGGNFVQDNQSNGNSGFGFADTTTGSGTSGTANTYADNICVDNVLGTSNPPELCDGH